MTHGNKSRISGYVVPVRVIPSRDNNPDENEGVIYNHYVRQDSP